MNFLKASKPPAEAPIPTIGKSDPGGSTRNSGPARVPDAVADDLPGRSFFPLRTTTPHVQTHRSSTLLHMEDCRGPLVCFGSSRKHLHPILTTSAAPHLVYFASL